MPFFGVNVRARRLCWLTQFRLQCNSRGGEDKLNFDLLNKFVSISDVQAQYVTVKLEKKANCDRKDIVFWFVSCRTEQGVIQECQGWWQWRKGGTEQFPQNLWPLGATLLLHFHLTQIPAARVSRVQLLPQSAGLIHVRTLQ